MRWPEYVQIKEVGPRDGLQNEKTVITPELKAELINRLARAGLQTIESGSFVSPRWVPQVSISKATDNIIVCLAMVMNCIVYVKSVREQKQFA